MDVDAVLLDLDGTLSEAGPAIAAAVSLALEHCGHDPLDEDALRGFVGPPLEDSFAALGFDQELVHEAVQVYRDNYELLGNPLYPGVADALLTLRGAGLRLALATSKPQELADEIVVDAGLAPLLEVVAGSDPPSGVVSKGDVVALALARLGDVRAAVMVGDRSYDVRGAAKHGLPCIGVLWGYGSTEELMSAGAVALVSSASELVDLLLSTTAGQRDPAVVSRSARS